MEPKHYPARVLDRNASTWNLLTETRLGDRVLYRFYDEAQQPLYIGITHNGDTRLATHRLRSEWWPLAEFIAVSVYPNWTALEEAERAAIRAEAPRFNKAGMAWRKRLVLRLDQDPTEAAAELHRIGRPEFLRELAEQLSHPERFPQPSPPPPATFPGEVA